MYSICSINILNISVQKKHKWKSHNMPRLDSTEGCADDDDGDEDDDKFSKLPPVPPKLPIF